MHLRCFVHGHEDLRHCELGRLYLRCEVCGRETRGWTLDLPAPRSRLLGWIHRERQSELQAPRSATGGVASIAERRLDLMRRPTYPRTFERLGDSGKSAASSMAPNRGRGSRAAERTDEGEEHHRKGAR